MHSRAEIPRSMVDEAVHQLEQDHLDPAAVLSLDYHAMLYAPRGALSAVLLSDERK